MLFVRIERKYVMAIAQHGQIDYIAKQNLAHLFDSFQMNLSNMLVLSKISNVCNNVL